MFQNYLFGFCFAFMLWLCCHLKKIFQKNGIFSKKIKIFQKIFQKFFKKKICSQNILYSIIFQTIYRFTFFSKKHAKFFSFFSDFQNPFENTDFLIQKRENFLGFQNPKKTKKNEKIEKSGKIKIVDSLCELFRFVLCFDGDCIQIFYALFMVCIFCRKSQKNYITSKLYMFDVIYV